MKILLLGSGGREHAFAHFLAKSPHCEKLWIAPGNAGTSLCGENVILSIFDFDAVYAFCTAHGVDTILPGGEDTLVAGIADAIAAKNEQHGTRIRVAGPSKWAAQLEGSKDFSKAFMQRHGIPTAGSFTATQENLTAGKEFLRSLQPPYVLKADGLAAGKGVIITENLDEAFQTLDDMILNARFGAASARVVIEEFLHGIEISVFAVSDGQNWKLLASAKDYKRIGEGDTGPNTGGMGAISPVPFADDAFMKKVSDRIAGPTFEGLQKEGQSFRGFLFIGLMNCGGEPYVIEYNVRMGDPETEAIFPRLKTDMGTLIEAIAGQGVGALNLELDPRSAATIFLVSGGYPGDIEKGKAMEIPAPPENCICFHGGTLNHEGTIKTNGGRVLAITSLAADIPAALEISSRMAEKVQYEGKYFRRDIGLDLLKYVPNSQ